MNVSLTSHLEEFVKSKVQSGSYQTASEVVREALRLMEQRDKFQVLRAAVAEGAEQIERGEVIPFTDTTIEQLRQDAIQASKDGHRVSPLVTP